MSLEDFFTLSERNNGLMSPSRVEELLTIMQNEKDCHVDSARQWSAVASAIAATDNKDCLDVFIQLDGLHFFGKWLTDAQKFSNNTSDTFLSESISNLLQAIQKLPVEFEKLVVSGIWTTLEDLLISNIPKIQEKAQVLYQKWKRETDGENIVASSDNKVRIAEDTEKANILLEEKETVLAKGQESTSHDPVQNMPEVSEPFNGDESTLDNVISDSSDKPTTIESRCQDAVDAVGDFHQPVDAVGDFHQPESPHNMKNSPKNEKSTEKEISLEKSKISLDRPVDSCSDATDAVKSENESNSKLFSSNVDEISLCNDILRATDLEGKSAMDVNGYLNQSRSSKAYKHPILRKSSNSNKSLKTPNKRLQMADGDLANKYNFADKGSQQGVKESDIELDYATFDPLEVARQVAIEVEREVIDYKEQSCSSSSDKPDSPHDAKHSSNSESGSVKDTINSPDSSASSSMNEDSSTGTETLDAEQRNVTPEMESSQVREPAQIEVKPVKEVGNFDLNEEICSDDIDHSTKKFSTPVSIVSASKAKAAPEQPAAPLQFEGNLGWKGSAATSAFRPASPRRNLESEKGRFLDFDLNIAESVDGEGEPSFAASSGKYELDLNHASEDGPSSLNFDLNGQPSLLNDSSDRYCFNKSSQNHVSGGIQSDDSVISIMGKRVQVNRKDSFSQTQPLLIGHSPELAFDLNLGRSGNFLGIGSVAPYTHSSAYGYNNIGPGPGSSMPFSSPVYGGPIPYMVDSRGAPVMPQLMGPVSSLPTSFAQPPFVVNMIDPSPSNGFVPSNSNFDMTSGLMVGSGSGSGEPVGFRQFLSSGQLRTTMDEQMRPNSQSNMGSVVGKRKEPENGWENYPFRHYTN